MARSDVTINYDNGSVCKFNMILYSHVICQTVHQIVKFTVEKYDFVKFVTVIGLFCWYQSGYGDFEKMLT